MGIPDGGVSEMVDLQDQIVKLKALLATKREQVFSHGKTFWYINLTFLLL